VAGLVFPSIDRTAPEGLASKLAAQLLTSATAGVQWRCSEKKRTVKKKYYK
jgi:hypothetical protein